MSRFVGYGLLVVSLIAAFLVVVRVTTMIDLAELGAHRPGAVTEITILILCGIVNPIGIAALLLRKPM